MRIALSAAALLAIASCKPPIDTDSGDTNDSNEQSLYDQLGGDAGVGAVLDSFLARVLANDDINWMFANADGAELRGDLLLEICKDTGGGCVYDVSMAEVHADMAITEAQWNSMLGDFVGALDDNSVAYTAPNFDGGLPADQLVVALVGMHDDIVFDQNGDTVLFNQLGGHDAVVAVVDDFVTHVGADARINCYFATSDLVALKAKLVDQVCEATGGFCTYSGLNMTAAHQGLGITDGDFNALVEDFLLGLDDNGVAYTSPNFDGGLPGDSLILALAGMQTDIVEDAGNNATSCI